MYVYISKYKYLRYSTYFTYKVSLSIFYILCLRIVILKLCCMGKGEEKSKIREEKSKNKRRKSKNKRRKSKNKREERKEKSTFSICFYVLFFCKSFLKS